MWAETALPNHSSSVDNLSREQREQQEARTLLSVYLCKGIREGGWIVNMGSLLRAGWRRRVHLICFQVVRRCRLSSFYSLPLHSSVLKPHFHLWIKMISDALKPSGNHSADKSRAIQKNPEASKSKDLRHCFWQLNSEDRMHDPCASHSAFSTETQEHGPSVPTLFLHAPSRQNPSATHFESEGWRAAKICRMHRKMSRKSCTGIQEKARAVLGSGICSGPRAWENHQGPSKLVWGIFLGRRQTQGLMRRQLCLRIANHISHRLI